MPKFSLSIDNLMGRDAIGDDATLTTDTGGFSATQDGTENRGHPAVGIQLTGRERLAEFQVVAFAKPSFGEFNYRLDVWRKADYLTNDLPLYSILLLDLQKESWGNAGPFGDNAPTFKLTFDLANVPQLSLPLPAGDWILGFQSRHIIADEGELFVSGTSAGVTPYFSRDTVPRGVLGGEPFHIPWAIVIYAETDIEGNFNYVQAGD